MAQEPSKPLSSWRATWEGLKLSTKNLKLILPILSITLFISSTLYLAEYHSIYPLLFELFNNLYPATPSPPKDLKPLVAKLAILQCIFTVSSFILSYSFLIITVNATAVTYLRPQATLGEVFKRMKRTWKGALITQLFVAVLSFACMLVILVIVVFFVWLAKNSLIFLLLRFALELCCCNFDDMLVILVLFLYVLEATVWYYAVVISVVDGGYYGMKAIVRAKELMEGRRMQSVAIMFLIFRTGGAIIGIVYAAVGSTKDSGFGRVLMVIVTEILIVVMLAYTVFY